jgi:large subunit ribosomal protein L9
MKIILLDKIQGLGEIGDIVEVNSGYARNFLIPQKKAAFASDKNIKEVEARKEELAAASADLLTQAQGRSESIEGSSCEIFVPVTEEGALYGSVGTREISEAFIESGVEIDKSEVQLPDGPIKEQGEFNIVISVHPEVSANVVVKVSSLIILVY